MSTPPPSLTVTARRTADGIRLELAGELDHETAGGLLTAAREHLTAAGDGPGPPLELGLAGLTDCDSTGLAALLRIRRLVDAAGGRMRLEDRPALLDRMLYLTGTAAYLTGTAEHRTGTADYLGPADGGRDGAAGDCAPADRTS
ncbi:anti-sigma factor antagonist [Streptomyces solincola]|uniref:Anti-sigma factor antagonist n=1 Tax=Streptomyces solincola TaxID=2100817 RepID=A0A2S9PMM8_9ACTN|nr:STAS domain-containing protein [Streptomyces solincola]PRH75666.1 anti-sigma factor antagonist [Streptomyces solincola]